MFFKNVSPVMWTISQDLTFLNNAVSCQSFFDVLKNRPIYFKRTVFFKNSFANFVNNVLKNYAVDNQVVGIFFVNK